MRITRSDRSPATVAPSLLALGLSPGDLAAQLQAVFGAFGATLGPVLADEEFTGGAGQSLAVRTFGHLPAARLVLVGMGGGSPDDLRRAAGAAASAARSQGATELALALGPLAGPALTAVVEGLEAGAYRFDKYRPAAARKAPVESVELLGAGEDAAAVAFGAAVAAAQSWARDLVNEPGDVIFPESLADAARSLASAQIDVEVWEGQRLVDERMTGILAVGKGSARGPRFIRLVYRPSGAPRRKLGVVGKGVTFDSGGLSLKPSASMQTMRCDMAGSAAVLGLFRVLAETQPDVEVHGFIGAVENMLGGAAYKLGDILTFRNGVTVEIHNTDAEGRLVLADCLCLASEAGLEQVVDIATLTGACMVAVGDQFSGLFTDDDALAADLHACAAEAGEGLWRLPLAEAYRELIKGEWGHIKNVASRGPGATTAALFLKEFVSGPRWAHLDIAGPAFLDAKSKHFVTGGTGAMVPTLARWLHR
jgi:leucyl aminopeptidase